MKDDAGRRPFRLKWLFFLASLLLLLAGSCFVIMAYRASHVKSVVPEASGTGKPAGEGIPFGEHRTARHADKPHRVHSLKPLLPTWSDIPTRYLSLPFAITSGSGPLQPLTHGDIGAELTWAVQLYGYPADAIDRQVRALAIVETVDHYLAKLAGMTSALDVMSDNQHYFPAKLHSGCKPPSDPIGTRRALLQLLQSSDYAALIEQLPLQHRCDGIENVARCRVLSLLGSLGADNETHAALTQAFYSDAPPQVKATAFRAMLDQGGQSEREASAWFRGHTEPEVTGALLAALGPAHVKYSLTSDPSHLVKHTSRVSLHGRELDEDLIRLLNQTQDADTRATIATALAARTDNPSVSQAAIGLLAAGEPETVLAVLNVRPNLLENVQYQQNLRLLLTSSDRRVRNRALSLYASVPDPGVRDVIMPYVFDKDPQVVTIAVIALRDCGRYDPQGTLKLLQPVVAKRLNEEDMIFYVVAQDTLSILGEIAADLEGYRRKNEEFLRREGQDRK